MDLQLSSIFYFSEKGKYKFELFWNYSYAIYEPYTDPSLTFRRSLRRKLRIFYINEQAREG